MTGDTVRACSPQGFGSAVISTGIHHLMWNLANSDIPAV
jgi:hypothetical protein